MKRNSKYLLVDDCYLYLVEDVEFRVAWVPGQKGSRFCVWSVPEALGLFIQFPHGTRVERRTTGRPLNSSIKRAKLILVGAFL